MFAVGDRVRSMKVGRRAAFEGVVVEEREATKYFPPSFDVKDDEGMVWNRGKGELTMIAYAQAKRLRSDHDQ